jgi:hypothetical protein
MKKSDELRELTLRSYEALTGGGHAFYTATMSQQDGVLAIGSDPSEWWAGYDTITSVFKAQIEEMSGITIIDSDPQTYSDGSVGWSADSFMVRFPDGTEVPFRVTMVFHQEQGEWKIVQWHGSIGIPNEEAMGQELTV